MNPLPSCTRRHTGLIALAAVQALGLGALSACGSILPKPPALPTLFTLDDGEAAAPDATPAPSTAASRPAAAPTLLVAMPRAAPGFDTEHIVYVRRPHQVEAFAHNQWVAPPAQMLAPIMLRALQRSGAFQAVLMAPGATASQLRLDIDLVRLQHEFTESPSQVRLTLRAVLIDPATRRVLGWREFERSAPATSDDPYGGVAAAHRVVRDLMADLVRFCVETARR
jgi:cholesterol transport system auxiliary component